MAHSIKAQPRVPRLRPPWAQGQDVETLLSAHLEVDKLPGVPVCIHSSPCTEPSTGSALLGPCVASWDSSPGPTSPFI